MTDTVERVAWAIGNAVMPESGVNLLGGFSEDDVWWLAGGALQALSDAGLVVVPREPTTRMVAVANNWSTYEPTLHTAPSRRVIRQAWQAMLKAYENG